MLTGVALIRVGRPSTSASTSPSTSPGARSFVTRTEVTFVELTDGRIEAYVATGEPLDKAGAYGIQGRGRRVRRRIHGSYHNVVGLPLAQLAGDTLEAGPID